ncbi:Ser/Thr protein kinase [Haloferax mucosum ATCC BAA-1512]|uniref:Ser/Thr protein kinase n=2 Tax=Haloferax mucosum TaxID=403181 RepID=M0I5I9_9EURY|nr:Ser/Thr protein kinase [Haloferax mucosum ATCC BAA-1512]
MTDVFTAGDQVFATNGRRNVYALTAGSGEKQWAIETDVAVSVETVTEDNVLVEAYDDQREESTLFALDRSSGEENWRFERDEHTLGPVVLAGGHALVEAADRTGTVFALDPATGEIHWQFECDASLSDAPLVFDGKVYLASQSGTIHRLELSSGTETRSYQTESSDNNLTHNSAGLYYFDGAVVYGITRSLKPA